MDNALEKFHISSVRKQARTVKDEVMKKYRAKAFPRILDAIVTIFMQ